jgi:hypothetical protein
MMMFT